MENKNMMNAEILLPLNLEKTLSYSVPEVFREKISIGMRVVVELRGRLYTAIVVSLTKDNEDNLASKEIIDILDDSPCVNTLQLRLWKWIAEYYCCTTGEVMRAALPSALKIESDTKIELLQKQWSDTELNDDEYIICEALENSQEITVKDVVDILGKKNVMPTLNRMMNNGLICIFKEYVERYRPKTENFVFAVNENNFAENAINATEKREKQRTLIMAFLSLNGLNKGVSKKKLLDYSGVSSAVLDTLIKNKILKIVSLEVDRIKGESADNPIKELSDEQKNAEKEILNGFEKGKTVLLHGVTGSGKTEIYVDIIRSVIEKGGQVLYLLPEIALTTQLISRLKKYFGEKIGVYHSKYNDMQRAEVWNRTGKAAKNRFDIIIGARSAIFLPFENLKLIIVDEEHDSSFKQTDPAPRYNARDTALILGKISGSNVLLGSATPAVESFFNALDNKYQLVSLEKRYGDVPLPHISVVNIKDAYALKQMNGHFSIQLIEAINTTLENKEQVILFQNRRGYAPVVECRDCGWTPKCSHCDVSMTYHKHSDNMRCHYCGYSSARPVVCPVCGSVRLETKGFGTEQVQIEAEKLFPDAKILRMDLDTTGAKNSYQNIITTFENREADILIGTQMLSKGLDFDHVALVGILNADNTFKNESFRAYERGYQLLSQVSGRSGRKNEGEVIIQTYDPLHPVIQNVISSDYISMYHSVIGERKNFFFPPFCRMARIVFKHKNIDTVNIAADLYTQELKKVWTGEVLGPEFYHIPRINSLYIKHIYLKFPSEVSLSGTKKTLRYLADVLSCTKEYRSLRITIDIDPM
ncbi:MAG: primosomal protein N' [Flavobacteriales bacterium]|nr:primosomal protein N' [Flavobacteriales bacterium]